MPRDLFKKLVKLGAKVLRCLDGYTSRGYHTEAIAIAQTEEGGRAGRERVMKILLSIRSVLW